MSFFIKKYLKNQKNDKNPYSGTHLRYRQSIIKPHAQAFPLLIVLHWIYNHYTTIRRR